MLAAKIGLVTMTGRAVISSCRRRPIEVVALSVRERVGIGAATSRLDCGMMYRRGTLARADDSASKQQRAAILQNFLIPDDFSASLYVTAPYDDTTRARFCVGGR